MRTRVIAVLCCLASLQAWPASCAQDLSAQTAKRAEADRTSKSEVAPAGVLGQGKAWETPFFVRESGVDGPVVIVSGGIHGNEPSGAATAAQISHWPIVKGKLIVIPRANPLGLKRNTRYVPSATKEQRDLNRNFPSPGIAEQPRGEIAIELWQFVLERDPDWLFDLHEGYEFNVSHKPKAGKSKSVGSSIIFRQSQGHGPLVQRMLSVVNSSVEDPSRKFVRLGRGPKKTTLANAVIEVLGKPAMILETTYKRQPLDVRTRQHRAMMVVAFQQLGMLDKSIEEIEKLSLAISSSNNNASPETISH